jgi:AcrR family transcriptional regulator
MPVKVVGLNAILLAKFLIVMQEKMQAKISLSASSDGLEERTSRRPALRGRPRQLDDAARRERILVAAEQVFVELGYGAANVDAIARRAGMSKKTIYQVFETKQDLFAAVIESRRDALAAMVAGECSDDALLPEEVLRGYLRQIARFVLAPRQAALYRLAVTESQRAPELANAFHREGSTKVCSPLTEWLALQHERGVLHVPDPGPAAKMLLYMAIAELQMRLLIGEPHEPDEATIDRRVDDAVRVFLDGARARASSSV